MIECKIEKMDITPELALLGLRVAEQYMMQDTPKSADSVELTLLGLQVAEQYLRQDMPKSVESVELPFQTGNKVIARIGKKIVMITYDTEQQAVVMLRRLKGDQND